MKLTPEQAAALDMAARIPYSELDQTGNEQLQSAILSGHVVEVKQTEGTTEMFAAPVPTWFFRLHYRAAFVAAQEWIPIRKFVELWPTLWAVNVRDVKVEEDK